VVRVQEELISRAGTWDAIINLLSRLERQLHITIVFISLIELLFSRTDSSILPRTVVKMQASIQIVIGIFEKTCEQSKTRKFS